jgi:hypothetical protein
MKNATALALIFPLFALAAGCSAKDAPTAKELAKPSAAAAPAAPSLDAILADVDLGRDLHTAQAELESTAADPSTSSSASAMACSLSPSRS